GVVVSEGRMVDREQDSRGQRVGSVPGGRRRVVASNDDVTVQRGGGVVDKEETVAGIVRVEREAEEPAFTARRDEIVDVEDRPEGRTGPAGVDRVVWDAPGLLHDEEPIVSRVGDGDRRRQPRGPLLELALARGVERPPVARPLRPGGTPAVLAGARAAAGGVADRVARALVQVIQRGGAAAQGDSRE